MTQTEVLPEIRGEQLLPPLRAALRNSEAEPGEWSVQKLAGGRGLPGGVYRLAGTAAVGQTTVPWSLILKVVTDPGEDDDEGGVNYRRREFLAYRSGLLRGLPVGIGAPRCFGGEEHPGEGTWLWLEDVQGAGGPVWGDTEYRQAARHLGRFNGASALGPRPPSHRWLNRQLIRRWLLNFPALIERFPAALASPAVQPFCRPSDGERLLGLWRDQALLLDALERLPQSLCHHDAIRGNLVNTLGHRTVAIDWEFTGMGAIGEELGPLVSGTLGMMGADASSAREMDEAAFEGYMEGLEAAGWSWSRDAVRFAATTSAALRFGVVFGAYLVVCLGGVEDQQAELEAFYERPIEAIVEHFAVALPWMLDRGDEARRLLGSALRSSTEAAVPRRP